MCVPFTRCSDCLSAPHCQQQGFSKPLMFWKAYWNCCQINYDCIFKFEKEASQILRKSSMEVNFSLFSSTPASAGGSSIPMLSVQVTQSLSPCWFWQVWAVVPAVLVSGSTAPKAATDVAAVAAAGAAARGWGSGEPALGLSRSPCRWSAPQSCSQVAGRCWNPWSSLGGPWRAAIHGWWPLECRCWGRNKMTMSHPLGPFSGTSFSTQQSSIRFFSFITSSLWNNVL